MKKIFLSAIFCLWFNIVNAQEKQIESFLGIKFGSSKYDVMKAMSARGSIIDTRHSHDDIQQYTNVKLGTRTVDVFSVRFVNNKVFEASFYFIPKLESRIVNLYDDIVDDVNTVYGKGESYKTFKPPFKEGDGFEVTAIKTGNSSYSTYWIIKNSISATILPESMAIKLTYQDSELIKIAIGKQNEINKSDF